MTASLQVIHNVRTYLLSAVDRQYEACMYDAGKGAITAEANLFRTELEIHHDISRTMRVHHEVWYGNCRNLERCPDS